MSLDDMPSRSIDLSSFRPGSEVNSSIIRFRKGDILFGAMRPYFHKVGLAQFDGITRTTTLVLRPKRREYAAFALFTLASDEVVDFSASASVGSTIPYVRWDALADFRLNIPSVDEAGRFQASVEPLLRMIGANGEEMRVLDQLKKAIFPEIMPGRVIFRGVQERC